MNKYNKLKQENKILKNIIEEETDISKSELIFKIQKKKNNTNDNQEYRFSRWKDNDNKNDKFDNDSGYIYIIKEQENGRVKIGKAKHYINRLNIFNVKLPFPYEVIKIFEVSNRHKVEKLLHDNFSNKRLNGEWFELNDEDIEAIYNDKEICDYINNEIQRARE